MCWGGTRAIRELRVCQIWCKLILLLSYKKAELKSFLQFHREGDEPLRDDEVCLMFPTLEQGLSSDYPQIGILNGVLSLNEKRVQSIMTPINDCLTLPSNKVLDHATIDHILLSGFSRIPIHEPGQKDNFMGMLLVKRVWFLDKAWPISLRVAEVRLSAHHLQSRRRMADIKVEFITSTRG